MATRYVWQRNSINYVPGQFEVQNTDNATYVQDLSGYSLSNHSSTTVYVYKTSVSSISHVQYNETQMKITIASGTLIGQFKSTNAQTVGRHKLTSIGNIGTGTDKNTVIFASRTQLNFPTTVTTYTDGSECYFFGMCEEGRAGYTHNIDTSYIDGTLKVEEISGNQRYTRLTVAGLEATGSDGNWTYDEYGFVNATFNVTESKGSTITGYTSNKSSSAYPNDNSHYTGSWYTKLGSDTITATSVGYSTSSPKGGQAITINVTAGTPTYGGTIRYTYQVKLDSGSWTTVTTNSTSKSVSYTIPKGTTTFAARVLASDTWGFTDTDYTTGSTLTVINNTAPEAPTAIYVPSPLYAGLTAVITWGNSYDVDSNLSGYKLERSTNGGSSYSQIFQGNALTYTDTIPLGVSSVIYRVRGYDTEGENSPYTTGTSTTVSVKAPIISVPSLIMSGQPVTITWTESGSGCTYTLERQLNGSGSWTQIYQGSMVSYIDTASTWTSVAYRVKATLSGIDSVYSASTSISLTSSDSLVISGNDSDLGTITNDVTYTISTNTGNPITVTETINGWFLRSYTATNGAENSVNILDLPNDDGTLMIIASVKSGSSTIVKKRTFTYHKDVPSWAKVADIAQLSKNGYPMYPITLDECVRVKGGKTLDQLLNSLPFAELYVTAPTGSIVKCTKDSTTLAPNEDNGVWKFAIPEYGTWVVTAEKGGVSSTVNIDVDTMKRYNVTISYASQHLNDNTWATIQSKFADGTAAAYWAVGDTKTITLNGTAGGLTVSNLSVDVFIIGINHNSSKEGSNKGHFQIGKINGTLVTFVDTSYANTTSTSGRFVMNTTAINTNGWSGTQMRTTVLGNSGTPTSPTSGSFMALLPSDLRAVMTSVVKYTDNVGGTSNAASAVTPTTEYLSLLSEFELFGQRAYANSAEQNYQEQYTYYLAGNSKIVYKHSSTSESAICWLRSIYVPTNGRFCVLHYNGLETYNASNLSYGISPIFFVG